MFMHPPRLVYVADLAQVELHLLPHICCSCRSTTPSKGNVAAVGKRIVLYYHQKQMATPIVLYARYLFLFNK